MLDAGTPLPLYVPVEEGPASLNANGQAKGKKTRHTVVTQAESVEDMRARVAREKAAKKKKK